MTYTIQNYARTTASIMGLISATNGYRCKKYSSGNQRKKGNGAFGKSAHNRKRKP